ncbi:MAG TPA: hypothetical protein VJ255_16935, partial [Candidatus Acidoferrum sp.]|nr:hypothetical protein [Candidatus Acidoferrum sp.]
MIDAVIAEVGPGTQVSDFATSQELAQLSKSSTGKVNANTGHLTCEADATPNTGLRELAVYTDSLVSDG